MPDETTTSQLPAPDRAEGSVFVGRTLELERLRRALADQPGKVLLHGPPGSGKTTLAARFAAQHAAAFDEVVVQPCSGGSIDQVVVELGRRLGVETDRMSPEDQRRAAVARLGERRSLLVLDELEETELWDLLGAVSAPTVSVLGITMDGGRVAPAEIDSMALGPFSEDEVEALFAALLGPEPMGAARDLALELGDRLERLPLAVALAARFARGLSDRPDPRPLLEELHARTRDLASLLDQIIQQRPDSDRALLPALAACRPAGFWLPLAAEVAGLTEAKARDAAQRLADDFLLRALDRDSQRFQLHAPIREHVRRTGLISLLGERRVRALQERYYRSTEAPKGCRECLPEAMDTLDELAAVPDALRFEGLAVRAGEFAWRNGELVLAMAILQRQTAFWEAREGPEAKTRLASALGKRAVIESDWRRWDVAMELLRRQQALCKELNDRTGLASSYSNEAYILQARERFDGALARLKQQETICRETDQSEELRRCFNNQAVVLFKLGRIEESLELSARNAARCLESNDRAELACCYWNWGLAAGARPNRQVERDKLRAARDIFAELDRKRELQQVERDLARSVERELKERLETDAAEAVGQDGVRQSGRDRAETGGADGPPRVEPEPALPVDLDRLDTLPPEWPWLARAVRRIDAVWQRIRERLRRSARRPHE